MFKFLDKRTITIALVLSVALCAWVIEKNACIDIHYGELRIKFGFCN